MDWAKVGPHLRSGQMIKTLKYKMIPTAEQKRTLGRALELCREVYNLCLEQRKMHRMSDYDQMREITQLRREFAEFQDVYSDVLYGIASNLHASFERMWRNGAGFPRFKGAENALTRPHS